MPQLISPTAIYLFKRLIFYLILIVRTSRFSSDFGTCVFVSALCFDRFFRRLLFFSLQLIATNSLARWISLIKDIDDYFGSLLTQGFVLSGRQENKTEERRFPNFLTEATHQNGAQHSRHANRSLKQRIVVIAITEGVYFSLREIWGGQETKWIILLSVTFYHNTLRT